MDSELNDFTPPDAIEMSSINDSICALRKIEHGRAGRVSGQYLFLGELLAVHPEFGLRGEQGVASVVKVRRIKNSAAGEAEGII